MASLEPAPGFFEQLRALRTPVDYFSEARGSGTAGPSHILCFSRRSWAEARAEPVSRQHHHRYVLIVPWKESGKVQVDARTFSLEPSQALLVFPFQFHHRFLFSRRLILWQYVTFEAPPSLAAFLEPLRAYPLRNLRPADLDLLRFLLDAWNRPQEGDEELGHWLALFLIRLRAGRRARPARTADKPPGPGRGLLLARLNAHIMQHLDRGLRVKELATFLSISESHLRTRFRLETGLSLGQHVRRLRLQKAMGMLLQTDHSVTQISDRCGFDSIFAFSRSFARFTGLSASAYRVRFAKTRLQDKTPPAAD